MLSRSIPSTCQKRVVDVASSVSVDGARQLVRFGEEGDELRAGSGTGDTGIIKVVRRTKFSKPALARAVFLEVPEQ